MAEPLHSRPLHTDLLIDPFGASWAGVRDTALAAADAGFEGLWTWDHLAGMVHGADRVLECWTTLTAIAGVVPDVAVGPLVLNVGSRHPGVLAQMAATLQEVSGGRLILGLGAGGGASTPYVREQEALGMPRLSDPARRLQVEDTVAVLRQLWTGRSSPVTGSGAGVQLAPGAGFLVPDPPPPIVVAGFGRKMAELAGRVGDGLNTRADHPQLQSLCSTARDAHAAAGGDPDRYLVTAFALLSHRWCDPASPDRQRLRDLGVSRLVLTAKSGGLKAIAGAGALLAAG
jgi:alkanesulfonate monooxygenase SsuD/methylene tetrahydromethanopterin reductase-like flavin-dependent oxidoreductase (luciferase family)